MSDRLIVVLGSGPGIGSQTAAHFAAQGFNRVALLSRNKQRLPEDAATIKNASSFLYLFIALCVCSVNSPVVVDYSALDTKEHRTIL